MWVVWLSIGRTCQGHVTSPQTLPLYNKLREKSKGSGSPVPTAWTRTRCPPAQRPGLPPRPPGGWGAGKVPAGGAQSACQMCQNLGEQRGAEIPPGGSAPRAAPDGARLCPRCWCPSCSAVLEVTRKSAFRWRSKAKRGNQLL